MEVAVPAHEIALACNAKLHYCVHRSEETLSAVELVLVHSTVAN